jgi:hypothetical protein
MKKHLLFIFFNLIAYTGISQPSLDDWKYAKEKEFCESIPYKDLKKECEDNAIAVDNYCKKSIAKMSGRDPITLKKDIENKNEKIKKQQDERNNLGNKKFQSSDDAEKSRIDDEIKKIDETIRKIEAEIEQIKGQIIEDKNALRDALSDAERCVEARKYAIRIFGFAKDKAGNESDPEIKEIAKVLIEKWSKSQEKHQLPLDEAEKRVSNIKTMLD